MRKSILLVIILSVYVTSFAQLNNDDKISILGTHKGFYLSGSIGPVFGKINDQLTGYGAYDMKIGGTGALLDLKLGITVKNNFIIHAALISSAIVGPTLENANNESVKSSNDIAVGEAMFGIGVTKYIMPENIFFAGTFGPGNFSFMDDTENTPSFSTKRGLAFQIKVGKEWLLLPGFGLGVAATYGKTTVNQKLINGDSEHLSSNRFGIVLNLTYNRVDYAR